MDRFELQKFIVDNILTYNGNFDPNFFRSGKNEEILNKIKYYVHFLDVSYSKTEILVCFLGGYTFIPKCIGNNPVHLTKNRIAFKTHCKDKKCVCHKEHNLKEYQKMKNTILKKYGVINARNIEGVQWKKPDYKKIQEKSKHTCLERYGVEKFSQLGRKIDKLDHEKIRNEYRNGEQTIAQLCEKYSATYSVIDEILGFDIERNVYTIEKYLNEIVKLHHKEKKSCVEIGKFYNCGNSTISRILHRNGYKVYNWNSSSFENEIYEFLKEFSYKLIRNTKEIIPPYELDFFLPDFNLAIECDGIYWHLEQQGKDKKYHLNKTKRCEEQNIRLIHIFENEWKQKQEIVKSRLKNLFGKSKTIYARNCKVRIVDNKTTRDFLEKSHIQGFCFSKWNYGLYYNDEVVSLMTFGKSRFSKKYNWELLRFCNKLGYSVVGGASRLLKQFNEIGTVVSYSDKRWDTGNLYEKLGFKYSHTSSPNYFYTKDKLKLESRNKYQKHKLHKLLEIFDPRLNEYQNMLNNGYDRIWDCGNAIWINR